MRHIGTVRSFDPIRKFGFIVRDDGQADLFYHLHGCTMRVAPNIGQRVQFDVEPDQKYPDKEQAVNVEPIE
jgi:CspA family cold shock protein